MLLFVYMRVLQTIPPSMFLTFKIYKNIQVLSELCVSFNTNSKIYLAQHVTRN